MYQFEKLDVWNEALAAIKRVYVLTKKFPETEKYALTDQLKRSVTSIALNIAEGRGLGNDKEFKRFLKISLGSLFETVANIKIAVSLGYIPENDAEAALTELNRIGAKIKALIKSLESKK